MESDEFSSEYTDISCSEEYKDVPPVVKEVPDSVKPPSGSRRIREKIRRWYGRKWIKSKGAILALMWNCVILDYYGTLGFLITSILSVGPSPEARYAVGIIGNLVQALITMILFPLGGWLADVYFGRYKVIHSSLWIMWSGNILLGACLLVKVTLFGGVVHDITRFGVFPITILAISCGIAGFKVNIIPFGTDQLIEGSSDQLSAFIHWYIFTVFVNIGIVSFPFPCLLVNSDNALLLRVLLQGVLMSIALCLDMYLKHWLIIEPGTRNPLKTVVQVLNYARKNKCPKYRSAFTYGEEEPSRIDFAKPQYGGPFNTEQVEDVKTFLRMFLFLIPAGGFLVIGIYTLEGVTLLIRHVDLNNFNCLEVAALSYFLPSLVTVFSIPFYEFLINPWLYRYVPRTLRRIGIGIVFYLASFIALFAIDTFGHTTSSNPNVTTTCIFDYAEVTAPTLDINFAWLAIPGVLTGFGVIFQVAGVYKFTFAQSPYNMKGLLIGSIFAMTGLFQVLWILMQQPFFLGAIRTSVSFPSCGSIYFLLCCVVVFAMLVVYTIAARWYKFRQRGDTSSHQLQAIAEEVYDRYLPDNK